MLLAVLLPVQGAVAAAMLCPVDGSGSQAELRIHAVGLSVAPMDHMEAHHHAGGGHVHAGSHHHGIGHGDKCNLCSACCSLTPLLGAFPSLASMLEPAGAAFPSLAAPAPTFFSDGQERPPRSI